MSLLQFQLTLASSLFVGQKMAFRPFSATAPGKVILSGEHAVVHGTHAVATVISMRAAAHFESPPAGQEDVVRLILDYDGSSLSQAWKLADLQAFRDELLAEYASLAAQSADGAASFGGDVESTTASLDPRVNVFQYRWEASPLAAASSGYAEEDQKASADLVKALRGSAKIFILMFVLRYECARALSVRISSELPIGAGLGSSAAVSTSIAAGFHVLRGMRAGVQRFADWASPSPSSPSPASLSLDAAGAGDRAVINTWAFQGERLIHGSPSGVDNTCAVFGGAIVFHRAGGAQHVRFLPSGCIPDSVRLVITDTRQPRETKVLVAGVGRYLDALPGTGRADMLGAFDGIAMQLVASIEAYIDSQTAPAASAPAAQEGAAQAFFGKTAELFPANQRLLDEVGVGHSKVTQVVAVSTRLGMPSKLTGAGGGGCVISLVPPGEAAGTGEKEAELRRELSGLGFVCFKTTQIGQDGVRIVRDA